MIGAQVQAALFAALTAARICDGRIYDQVPEGAAFPRVTIGDEQTIDDSDQCAEAWDVVADIHVWSRPVNGSKAEVKTIAAQIHTAVKAIAAISGFFLESIHHETTRVLRDPDGKTEHAVISYRFSICENV